MRRVQEESLTRELAALVGDPWSGAWYWRDHLEAMQTNPHCDPAFGTYRRTERRMENPDPDLKGVWGQVWVPDVEASQELLDPIRGDIA